MWLMAATVSLTSRPAVPFPYSSLEGLGMGLIPLLVLELFLCGSHKYALGFSMCTFTFTVA